MGAIDVGGQTERATLASLVYPGCSLPEEHSTPPPLAGANSLEAKNAAPDCFRGVCGLLFDMGDVLYDATTWRRWLHCLLTRLGVPLGYPALFRLWDREYLDEVHRGRRDYDQAFVEFLHQVGLSPGEVDEVIAASAAKRRELAASLHPLPGVRLTIQRLHGAGVPLAVLSDSEDGASALRRRLTRLVLGSLFTAVVSSADLGCTKPDRRCYQAALDAMRLSPRQVAFVGHDDEELQGAAAVGMPRIAFNYEPGAGADAYIRRFEELEGYVRLRGEGAAA